MAPRGLQERMGPRAPSLGSLGAVRGPPRPFLGPSEGLEVGPIRLHEAPPDGSQSARRGLGSPTEPYAVPACWIELSWRRGVFEGASMPSGISETAQQGSGHE
eukprot:8681773-Pyramimonas_sp.AAC.1